MGAGPRLLIILTLISWGAGSPARGQSAYEEIAVPPATAPDATDSDGGFGVHFQVGAFTRLTTNTELPPQSPYLVTGDLVGLNWSRTESTFGLGVHFTFGEDDHRLGVKGLWRTPLVRGKAPYLQFAPGVYFSSTGDDYTFSRPGYFLEAELGLAEYFAVVAALELLPYEDQLAGWDSDAWEPVHSGSGTATSAYVGAKVGQWPGFGVVLFGVLIGGIVFASAMSNGGIMGS